MRSVVPVVLVSSVVWCMAVATASAHPIATGGTAAPVRPQVRDVRCDTGSKVTCVAGELLSVRGEYLQTAARVEFLGGPGRRDDRRTRPRAASVHRVLVKVPAGASTGPVRVVGSLGDSARRSPKIEVVAEAPVTAPVEAGAGGVFPVQGPVNFGTAVNGFGGGRGHQGQDLLSACGTPIVAALGGEVTTAQWQSAAGNFVVITGADSSSQVYMHMLARAEVRVGDQVVPWQRLGVVGQTGRATACHLHFELWTAPGWYTGGHAVDPRPALTGWKAAAASSAK